jgi:hypothetical protein
MRCAAVASRTGERCKRSVVADGHCRQHQGRRDDAEAWRSLTDQEVERRRRYALMRVREAQADDAEEKVIFAQHEENLRISECILSVLENMPAQHGHEIAGELNVDPGAVYVALEKLQRAMRFRIVEQIEELKQSRQTPLPNKAATTKVINGSTK